ncbi:unnamed protein product [Gongylonema pulchrum]|uniref:Protein-serine/threonine phosphatase n=1 Tax=Gongylonema pulchrum TaxID=637853 RepID=A0A183DUV1_9BILA|nr:unnamed protein product [Gongylonema pulchrum]
MEWNFDSNNEQYVPEVEATYDGPVLEGDISAEFMEQLIETFKAQKKLHKKYAYKASFCGFSAYEVKFCRFMDTDEGNIS